MPYKTTITSSGGKQMRMAVRAMRGEGGGRDRGLVDDNGKEAIGDDDVRHPKHNQPITGASKCVKPFT